MKQVIPFSQAPRQLQEKYAKRPPTKVIRWDYWQVRGQSWKGRTTYRDGKQVTCGHEHRSAGACARCLLKMKRDRPGNCRTYRIDHVQGYSLGFKLRKG